MRFSIILAGVCCLLVTANALASDTEVMVEAKRFLTDHDDKTKPVMPKVERAPLEVQKDVYRNVATDAEECLAYYYTLNMCVTATNKNPPPGYNPAESTEVVSQMKRDRKEMYELALASTLLGGLDEKTIKASVDSGMAMNSIQIHNDCGNLPIIAKMTRTIACKLLAKNPSERFRHWLDLAQQQPPNADHK